MWPEGGPKPAGADTPGRSRPATGPGSRYTNTVAKLGFRAMQKLGSHARVDVCAALVRESPHQILAHHVKPESLKAKCSPNVLYEFAVCTSGVVHAVIVPVMCT